MQKERIVSEYWGDSIRINILNIFYIISYFDSTYYSQGRELIIFLPLTITVHVVCGPTSRSVIDNFFTWVEAIDPYILCEHCGLQRIVRRSDRAMIHCWSGNFASWKAEKFFTPPWPYVLKAYRDLRLKSDALDCGIEIAVPHRCNTSLSIDISTE